MPTTRQASPPQAEEEDAQQNRQQVTDSNSLSPNCLHRRPKLWARVMVGVLCRRVVMGTGAGHWREMAGMRVSSLGLGTYLGADTEAADREYQEAVEMAVGVGINLLDTACNYRGGRSERVVGRAVAAAVGKGVVKREQLVVCTKGGYLSVQGRGAIEERLVVPGLLSWSDVADGCHCIAPAYLKQQVEESRERLGLATIDVYYLHNPEQQLQAGVPRDLFYQRIQQAFCVLEEECALGNVRVYGAATWNGFRQPPESKSHLSLERLLQAAKAAAGDREHHFRVIQLPFNLMLQEAATRETQLVGGKCLTLLNAAKELSVSVVASASLMQANLCKGLPADLRKVFKSLGNNPTDAQCALQFVRSTPGITSALVGMRQVKHVEENAAIIRCAADSR